MRILEKWVLGRVGTCMRPLHCHKFSKVAGSSSLPMVGHLIKCCDGTVPIDTILTVASVLGCMDPRRIMALFETKV